MAFAKFMVGGAGRVLRVVAGLAIIGAELVLVGGWFLRQAGKQETCSRKATGRTSHSPAD